MVSSYLRVQISVEVPLAEGGYVKPTDHVIGAEHISDLESVCVATGSGDILLYNTHSREVYTSYTHTYSLTVMAIYCVGLI